MELPKCALTELSLYNTIVINAYILCDYKLIIDFCGLY